MIFVAFASRSPYSSADVCVVATKPAEAPDLSWDHPPMRETRSLLSSAFMQETCHDLLRDHLSIRQLTWHVTMSASDRGTMSVYWRAKFEKRIGSPIGIWVSVSESFYRL